MKFLSLLLLLPALGVAAENCPKPSEHFTALYSISTSKNQADAKSDQHEMLLLRHGSRVAYEYKDKAISEVWSKAAKQRYRLVRYFDEHQRAIEYAASDIPAIKGDAFWQQKNQLISNAALAELGQPTLSGQGCDEVASYKKVDEGRTVSLRYLTHEKLVQSYQLETADLTVTWQLEEISKDNNAVKLWFAKRENFQATDYSDIGDNESDPFLMKMINLGFIEHGSSGIYRADGKAIKGEHQHHH